MQRLNQNPTPQEASLEVDLGLIVEEISFKHMDVEDKLPSAVMKFSLGWGEKTGELKLSFSKKGLVGIEGYDAEDREAVESYFEEDKDFLQELKSRAFDHYLALLDGQRVEWEKVVIPKFWRSRALIKKALGK